ncbi:hypothetical protein [Methylobacterium segetis]|uniref:hypothetical protein n=1 Tax=Methylobacterium segetis TaxID=2488750 RepID=UPI00104803F1|nr:hypothetical protein [Methylobacterium segetis]
MAMTSGSPALRTLLMIGAPLGFGAMLLAASWQPVAADGYRPIERSASGRHVMRRQGRPLPPEIAYRDPRYRPPVVAGPPVIVRAYLPRNNAVPMYNEPPARFPE